MSAPSPFNSLWAAHIDRLEGLARPAPSRREQTLDELDAARARNGEWTAAPPGRLGRLLLADIEPYLAFFAIAHASD